MRASLPQPAEIKRIIDESAAVKTFVLEERLEAEPGQFIMVWLPGVNEKPFSLVDSDPLTITVARVGPFTSEMHKLRVGQRLWFRGPLGRGFELTEGDILLVGGGYGVAPLAFLAKRAAEIERQITVIIGAETRNSLILERRFIDLGCWVVLVTEDGSAGLKGIVTEVAEELLSHGKIKAVYACGPEAMLDNVAELCRRYVIFYQLSMEGYMRCGLGICGSCQREGMLVCREGPVFPSGWQRELRPEDFAEPSA